MLPTSSIRWLPVLLLSISASADDTILTLDANAGFVVVDHTATTERIRIDEATGNISRNGALFVHTTGTSNAFVGFYTGNPATTGLGHNAAFGKHALRFNTAGYNNAAFGVSSLRHNTTGSRNAGVGKGALRYNTAGFFNSALGHAALRENLNGSSNAALGDYALRNNLSGSRNIAVGQGAGIAQDTGNDNIYLGNPGVAGESGQIKIGNTTDHTQATIAGIHTNTSVNGIAVLVNGDGKLGTTTSAERFKHAVEDLGPDSDVLGALRPVKFHYREDTDATRQYGLIAEEVAEVAPELVVRDSGGRPYSVRYHLLTPMLLNELQKQQRVIETLQEQVARLGVELTSLKREEASGSGL